jgi:hypothetical protein
MISMTYAQRTAVSLAWKQLPMATEEIAGIAAQRAAAPVGVRLQGMTLPGAGFDRSRIAVAHTALIPVGDRNGVSAVSGSVPRGRPV